MVVGGMQCVSRSYSLARTCKILAGVCSSMISLAIWPISASQSAGGIGVVSVTFSLRHRVSNKQENGAVELSVSYLLLCMDSLVH